MSRLLLVSKVPALARMAGEDVERLETSGVTSRVQLRTSEEQHHRSLDQVRSVLRGHQVRERRIDEIHRSDLAGVDLVISVGGDGTVLALNNLLTSTPLLAVNSDPERSVGHFTRSQAENFAPLFQAWQHDEAAIERMPRLALCLDDCPVEHHILNDCLFTNQNPAAMTRYVIDTDGAREYHYSSGVWIATGAGSTAAIHSAGSTPVDAHQPCLLFRVREPYHGRHRLHILAGQSSPPRPLQLTAAVPGIRLYIDGSHFFQHLPPGGQAHFKASPYPLQLVTQAPA